MGVSHTFSGVCDSLSLRGWGGRQARGVNNPLACLEAFRLQMTLFTNLPSCSLLQRIFNCLHQNSVRSRSVRSWSVEGMARQAGARASGWLPGWPPTAGWGEAVGWTSVHQGQPEAGWMGCRQRLTEKAQPGQGEGLLSENLEPTLLLIYPLKGRRRRRPAAAARRLSPVLCCHRCSVLSCVACRLSSVVVRRRRRC